MASARGYQFMSADTPGSLPRRSPLALESRPRVAVRHVGINFEPTQEIRERLLHGLVIGWNLVEVGTHEPVEEHDGVRPPERDRDGRRRWVHAPKIAGSRGRLATKNRSSGRPTSSTDSWSPTVPSGTSVRLCLRLDLLGEQALSLCVHHGHSVDFAPGIVDEHESFAVLSNPSGAAVQLFTHRSREPLPNDFVATSPEHSEVRSDRLALVAMLQPR